jgi:hypothetical protein
MKINEAAQALGRLGGKVRSEAKARASRLNALKGRRPKNDRDVQCDMCKKTWRYGELKKRWKEIPFFKAQLDQEYSSYYCGCRGWD